MELKIQNSNDFLNVSDTIFSSKINKSLIQQVITSYFSNSRKNISSQKNRSEVSGSGKKPWRQKGTGKARSGTKKSPIWRSGGVTFASKNVNYHKKINKKMYNKALTSILSELIFEKRLMLIKDLSIKLPKTKILINKIKKILLNGTVLIINDFFCKNLYLASRNLYKIKICNVMNLNPVSLIKYNNTLITISSIKKLEEILSNV